MTEPTFAQRLDAAKTDTEFSAVLNDLFTYLDNARDQQETDE